MKKKIIGCLLAACMFVTAITGCSPKAVTPDNQSEKQEDGSVSNAEKEKIVFWYSHKGDEATYYAKAAEEFNASQDKYEVEALSVTDRQKYIVAISGNEAPDVIEVINQDVVTYANSGLVEDMGAYAEADGYDLSVYSNMSIAANTLDETLYGVPLTSVIIQMYYNQDILEELGYDEPPKTMEELYEMAEAATELDDQGNISRLGYPLFPFASARQELIYAFGGRWWAEDGKTLTPDDPKILESLKMNVQYREKYDTAKVQEFMATANTNRYTENDMFFAGKQLFRFDGPWLAAMVDVFESDVNYGVTMIPGTEENPENRGSSRYETNSLAIPVVAQQKEGAWEFIKFITNSDYTKELLIGVGALPSLLSLYEDEDVLGQENYEAFVEALKTENGIQYATIADFAKYTSLIEEYLDYVYNGMKTPEEAMKELAEQAANLQ